MTGRSAYETAWDVHVQEPSNAITSLPPELERFPELQVLQPVFQRWGLDVNTVRFALTRLAPGVQAQTHSENLVSISPDLAARQDGRPVLGALAHELMHVVQLRELGFQAANARSLVEANAYGDGVHDIPEELRDETLETLNPIDERFTLEAIAGRMREIAMGAWT
jgi:hypothetical protein